MTVSILATIVLLGVLIFVHELGHFWAAKSVGIGVERFSIGLGPRVWGYTRGETEYVISAIPLGGYVKMQGMEDEVMEHLEGEAGATGRRSRVSDFDAQPLLARAFVISAGVVMNMFFAFLLYTFVAAAWGVHELTTTRVMEVDETSLPAGTEALADIAPGAEISRVGDVVPDSWGDIHRALTESPAGPLRVATESPAAVFAIVLPDDGEERRSLAAALQYWIDPVVDNLEPGGPAAGASMEPGDRITSVAGVPVESWAEMTREIGARPGETVEIGLLREDAALIRVVELDDVAADETGGRKGRLGIFPAVPDTRTISVGFFEAVSLGMAQTVEITRRILGFLKDLFTMDVSPRSVGSLGTIAVATGEAAAEGIPAYLAFMALFSINLAILNMLPIPVLDGGHMVFLAVELVRGRKLTVKQRVRWSQFGFVVVILIMVWALGNDLLRFLGL
ncbi:MAG: RIP metalloprotease RseP [Gemmatimonadota bacterium]|nr:RIP metalloprotease RseP [Gemmatimonadota bacterium]MDE2871598.1 RIP metalloprotease RseP [Gemmatimonadota bacterium]